MIGNSGAEEVDHRPKAKTYSVQVWCVGHDDYWEYDGVEGIPTLEAGVLRIEDSDGDVTVFREGHVVAFTYSEE